LFHYQLLDLRRFGLSSPPFLGGDDGGGDECEPDDGETFEFDGAVAGGGDDDCVVADFFLCFFFVEDGFAPDSGTPLDRFRITVFFFVFSLVTVISSPAFLFTEPVLTLRVEVPDEEDFL
jgi:hypothetical protein